MMIDTSKAVFPSNGGTVGMSLREHYAGLAMAAYIGNEPWLKEANEVSGNNPIILARTVSAVACAQADALIAQLAGKS
jgi:hypothetical protein